MRTDTEISYEGFSILFRYMDMIEAERFLTLVQREKFDYTQWRADILEDLTIEEISARAMEYVRSQEKQALTAATKGLRSSRTGESQMAPDC